MPATCWSAWLAGGIRHLGVDVALACAEGRTHRLAVVVAGMLQHAVIVALSTSRRRTAGSESSKALLAATQELDVSSVQGEIPELLERLLRDAGVSPDRVNARGDAYSIIDSAIAEFANWENMPWE